MNSIISRRNLRRASAILATLASTAGVSGQFVPTPVHWDTPSDHSSWVSFSAGKFSVDGSTAAFQAQRQHRDDLVLGLDAFRFRQVLEGDRIFLAEGRALAGDNEFRLRLRYENTATGSYLEGGIRESRVFYDGSGGYFPLNGQWFELFDPALSVDRGEMWLEGALVSGPWMGRARYSRSHRDGMKDSTMWGDTNLTGGFSTRNLVPAFTSLDETRNVIALDLTHTGDSIISGAGVRWENMETDNARNMRRRPTETADRYLSQREASDSDLFSMHAFTRMQRGEKLLLSAAASHTKIDTNFTGSRIVGSSFDASFDPLFPRRQARDEGFYRLVGDSTWKQTVLTANGLYLPAKNWRINGGLRYENQSQDTMAEFIETAVGTTSALITAQHELESDSARDFDELLGTIEATYTGTPNVVWTVFAEGAAGDGDLREDLIEADTGAIDIGRDTRYDRSYSKFGANARWYPGMGVNFAVGVFHRVRDNDYDTSDDTTPNLTGGDRYPAYIRAQRFATNDAYVRGTWRAHSTVSFVGRYDYQQTDIDSREDGLASTLSAEMTAHIFAGTLNWTPVSRVTVQGALNYVYDEVVTGAAASNLFVARQAGRFDNNYRTASLLMIYGIDDQTDLQVDGTLFQSGNYRNVAAVSLPFGLTARDRSVGVAATRRFDEDLVVGLRYAYYEYDNLTAGGHRDFTAHLVYGRLQLRY